MAVIHSIFMITILLYLLSVATRYCNSTPRKMVIDTDAGGDDALALMLALKCKDIEILAITCTYGNTELENVEQNVLKTLTIANRSDVPVYSGAQRPFVNRPIPDHFFGYDGFGDFNFTQNITAKLNKMKHASVLLIDLVKQHPGEITIVVLGPLTNIALAISLEPRFLYFVKQLVIMGSNVTSNSENIEFNFQQDPISNWITLNNTDKPGIIFPIDTVRANSISKEEYKDIFNNLDYTIAKFLYLAERVSLTKIEAWQPSDGMAMACALKPEIITKSFTTNLKAILVGDAKGSVEIDHNNKKHNAVVIEDINVNAFKNLLYEYLS